MNNSLLIIVAFTLLVAIANGQFSLPGHIPVVPPANAERNWALNLNGGHQRGMGTDVYVSGQKQLWQSGNRQNELHGGASYGQHFGGPYGNSRPQFGVGATYVHRFGRRR